MTGERATRFVIRHVGRLVAALEDVADHLLFLADVAARERRPAGEDAGICATAPGQARESRQATKARNVLLT